MEVRGRMCVSQGEDVWVVFVKFKDWFKPINDLYFFTLY